MIVATTLYLPALTFVPAAVLPFQLALYLPAAFVPRRNVRLSEPVPE